jgi:hypothetical protein
MANITVVVTFYSRGGATEALAHAAAVGAVQARALIRLRRVEDADPASILDRLPESRESLRRMHKEYVAPREADVLAADALILASPGDVSASAPEWSTYLDLLARLQSEGRLAGKVVAVVPSGMATDSSADSVSRHPSLTARRPATTSTAPSPSAVTSSRWPRPRGKPRRRACRATSSGVWFERVACGSEQSDNLATNTARVGPGSHAEESRHARWVPDCGHRVRRDSDRCCAPGAVSAGYRPG